VTISRGLQEELEIWIAARRQKASLSRDGFCIDLESTFSDGQLPETSFEAWLKKVASPI